MTFLGLRLEGVPDSLAEALEACAAERDFRPGIEPVAVTVIGPEVDAPVQAAQRAPSGQDHETLILTWPDRLDALRQAVLVSPFVGSHTRCYSVEDPELVSRFKVVLERARRAAGGRALKDFAQASLGTNASADQHGFLARILDGVPVGVALIDPEGRVVSWNRAAAEITGTSEADAIGVGLCDCIGAVDASMCIEVLETSAKEVQTDILRGDGVRQLHLTVAEPRAAGERVVVFRDVTQQVDAERRLHSTLDQMESRIADRTRELEEMNQTLSDEVMARRETERALAQAQRMAGIGAWTFDVSTGTVRLSDQASDLLGLRRGSALGRDDLSSLVFADDVQEALRLVSRMQDGHAVDNDVRMLVEGAVRHFNIRAPAHDKGVAKIDGVITDITQRRQLEAERLNALERQAEVERLKQVDAFKTGFINMTAHELSTPLTPMGLEIYLLSQRADALEDPVLRRQVTVLQRSFDRLSKLVTDVMDVVRLDADRMPHDPEALDLCKVVGEAVESARTRAAEEDINLECRLDGPLDVHGDRERMGQILDNLLSNGIQVTPGGGTLRVTAAVDDGVAVVSVHDGGPGLSEVQRARLFQPFGLAHDPDPGPGGTGLGLYISARIAEQNGGTLAAENAVDGGAVFTLRLPLSKQKLARKE